MVDRVVYRLSDRGKPEIIVGIMILIVTMQCLYMPGTEHVTYLNSFKPQTTLVGYYYNLFSTDEEMEALGLNNLPEFATSQVQESCIDPGKCSSESLLCITTSGHDYCIVPHTVMHTCSLIFSGYYESDITDPNFQMGKLQLRVMK